MKMNAVRIIQKTVVVMSASTHLGHEFAYANQVKDLLVKNSFHTDSSKISESIRVHLYTLLTVFILNVVMHHVGYEPDPSDGDSCIDIDECDRNTHNCASEADCSNTVGSFNCTCRGGFEGNGIQCTGKQVD